ncbi:host cell division inhibitor Icd-like protein, partial [Klebsiella variicola]
MIFTVQGKSLSLAGLMNAKAKALLVVCHRVNLSKPVTLRATDSGVQNAWRSFETITRDGHHTCSNVFSESIKKDLMFYIIPVYGYNAPAKSGA